MDGTRAPICFDEAVNIDTGENEADVDIETEGSDEVNARRKQIYFIGCFLGFFL